MSVSGNRGTQSQSTQEMQQPTVNNQKVSYAKIAQQTVYPKREQAIVTDSVEGITIKEYAVAIAQIIGPHNILYISRISHGRVCLYLSCQEIADKLTETHKHINIQTHTLEIRPLISKTKRIIISNVHPVIPNNVIENKLSEFNITPKSQISCIRAGWNDAGFTHILSFRRQMYVDPR